MGCCMNENNICMSHIGDYLFWNNFNFSCRFYRHDGKDVPVVHTHEDYMELVIVFSGSALHLLNGKTSKINSGQVFLLKKSDVHTYINPVDLQICNILFDEHFLQYLQPDIVATPGFRLLFHSVPVSSYNVQNINLFIKRETLPEIVNLLSSIVEAEKQKKLGVQTKIISDFLNLIYILSNNIVLNEKESGFYIYNISHLVSHLERTFSNDWSLAKMAQYAKMPLSNFRHVFTEIIGESPIRYLLDLRLKKSTELLLLNNMHIGEIAFLCGFHDLNYFCRQFRKKYNMSPSEYIKKYKLNLKY